MKLLLMIPKIHFFNSARIGKTVPSKAPTGGVLLKKKKAFTTKKNQKPQKTTIGQ